jgi:diadenosine tetraphosphate (Ap4A) HIT family hydrolase
MYHSRSKRKRYERQIQITVGCPFCDPAEINYRMLEQTEHAYVIPNKNSYDVWEHHRVLEHLMVIPKRHVDTRNDLNDAELIDLTRLTTKYEAAGYSVYARANTNPNRSVTHQHTHLIKIDTKSPSISLYMRNPYVVINV